MATSLEIYNKETAPKVAVMRHLLETGTVERRRNPLMAEFMEWYMALHLRKIKVIGVENFHQANKLRLTGNEFYLNANHLTDGDHLAFINVLKHLGYKSLREYLCFIAGTKMLTRKYVGPFTSAVDAIYIATPQDIIAYRDARKACTDPIEKEKLISDMKTLKKINQTAKEILEHKAKAGYFIMGYPEAGRTRSPEGLLKPPEEYYRSVAELFPKENAYILPVVMKGLLLLLPTNGTYRLGKRVVFSCEFGPSYPVEAIWAWVDAQKGRNPTEYLFARIGFIDPSIVEPKRYMRFVEIMLESRRLGY